MGRSLSFASHFSNNRGPASSKVVRFIFVVISSYFPYYFILDLRSSYDEKCLMMVMGFDDIIWLRRHASDSLEKNVFFQLNILAAIILHQHRFCVNNKLTDFCESFVLFVPDYLLFFFFFFFFCFVNILGKFGKKFIVAGGGGVQTVSRVTVNKAICFRIRSKLSNYFNFSGVQAETPIFWPGYYAKA